MVFVVNSLLSTMGRSIRIVPIWIMVVRGVELRMNIRSGEIV